MLVRSNQAINRYRYFLLTLSCLIALGCKTHDLEKRFFDNPAANRVERLRGYSLQEQYRIFRYGNDVKEPPAMELAAPIAERGAKAVPFLVNKLNSEKDDIALRDNLLIFERMQASGSYNVTSNASLMNLLSSKVSGMKDKAWQDTCVKMLERIRGSK